MKSSPVKETKAAANASPKKVVKPTKEKKVASHPPFKDMVTQAIVTLVRVLPYASAVSSRTRYLYL
jgi:hypothetical protein